MEETLELLRLQEMFCLEEELYSQGIFSIAGVDEAGRGPLAGPVVAAACILPQKPAILYLNDSKKLSPRKRESLFKILTSSEEILYSVQVVDVETIDRINILRASLLAMKKAVESLKTLPDYVLVDGNQGLDISIPYKAVVSGDALSLSIAAASILAKVTRDDLMRAFDEEYPEWGFAKHKGYGTKEHLQALKEHGVSPIHRKSFKLL